MSDPEPTGDLESRAEALLSNDITIGSEKLVSPQLRPILKAQVTEDSLTTALKKYDLMLQELRIRIGTLLKTDNLAFLLGAGCSIASGGASLAAIPLSIERRLLTASNGQATTAHLDLFYAIVNAMATLKLETEHRKTELDDDEEKTSPSAPKKDIRIPLNLESLLSQLQVWRRAIIGDEYSLEVSNGSTLTMKRTDLDNLIGQITKALAFECDLPKDGNRIGITCHQKFLKKILTRPLNLKRAGIFTLNYDTLIEQACDAEGVIAIDGFVGNLRRIFRPESFDQDLYFPAQTTEGRVHRLDRVIHLFKLHGSLTWHRAEPDWNNPYGLLATFYSPIDTVGNVLIYPTPLKYGDTLGFPYSELFRRFAFNVIQQQSVLFVAGYGFGDEHINALIRQALAVPSFTLVVIDPNPQSPFVELLRGQHDQRIWIIEGRDIGTFCGFVDMLLPDLREEEIMRKVISTFRSVNRGSVPTDEAEGTKHGE